jgi:hypothetical protein
VKLVRAQMKPRISSFGECGAGVYPLDLMLRKRVAKAPRRRSERLTSRPVASIVGGVFFWRGRMRKLLTTLVFGLALAVPQAYAGMIGIEDTERERVKSMLERPELAAELEKMGVPAAEARARVDAMTPQEVSQLAGRLDTLAAGGALSNQDLLLIIILLLLLIIIL